MAESITTSDPLSLVQEGRAALIAGDTYTARQCFRQALEIDSGFVDALIGIAGTVRAYREKRDYLLRALRIEPDHPEARAILAQVEARLAAGEVLAPGGVVVRESVAESPALPSPELVEQPNASDAGIAFCYRHPKRETGLRCTSCDRPICADCVRAAAVGQLCPECARSRRPVNYQVAVGDLLINGLVAVVYGFLMSIIAGFGLAMIGFFSLFLAFILGPSAGELLVRLIERLNRKRGRSIQITVSLGYLLGATLVVIFFFNLSLLLFTLAAVATAVARLR
ncbi:MAG: hypothetical protein HGA65_07755 [Oscillochloris sp.]|nr:hypothetical protein [Oscillochloris sp.]